MARGVKNTTDTKAAGVETPAANPATDNQKATKSDFEMAVENGYTGTEEQFNNPESVQAAIPANAPKAEAEKPAKEPAKKEVKSNAEPKAEAEAVTIETVFSSLLDLGFKGTAKDLKSFIESFEEGNGGTYVVLKPFKQAARHIKPGQKPTVYSVGDDVSHLSPQRIAELEEKGLIGKA